VIRALDHLVLTVRDLDATIRFYRDGLGMEARRFGPNRARVALHYGSQKINLHEVGKEFEPKAAVPTPGSGDFCFLSDQPVEDLKADLEAAGLEILEGPVERSGAVAALRSIYLRDPDGNLIEIANEVDPT
jgi:catechol 2,3-dioxygenase-like lactoylglutathione lyase family enzyme